MSKTNALAALQEQLAAELANLSKRVAPPSGNNISLKGGVFNLPDGTVNKGPMQAIILDWRMVNAYYTGPYDPANPKPPKCWAVGTLIDELAPPSIVEDRQHDACVTCPMNEFGSAPVGRGKACKNQRRLAIVPIDATEETQPMTLTVSPTGLTPFENYVNRVSAEMGALPIQVITKIGFDPSKSYPSLIFQPASRVAPEQLPTLMGLRQVAQAMLDRGFSKD